jgi:hypothetical protein
MSFRSHAFTPFTISAVKQVGRMVREWTLAALHRGDKNISLEGLSSEHALSKL